MDRTSLEVKLKELESQKESPVSTEDRARELVQQFLDSVCTSRELLVSLIERVKLTEDKQIIIKFRFRELEAISYGQSFTIGGAECVASVIVPRINDDSHLFYACGLQRKHTVSAFVANDSAIFKVNRQMDRLGFILESSMSSSPASSFN